MRKKLLGWLIASLLTSTTSWAHESVAVEPISTKPVVSKSVRTLLKAARVFDGNELHENYAVLVSNGKVTQIGPSKQIKANGAKVINLGDATILPGFIDMHTHLLFQHVDQDVVLHHGVTTARDTGGLLKKTAGGNGKLRLLTSGPIITIANGYPIPAFGEQDIAMTVATPEAARKTVQDLVKGGAAIIKISLEPGGEAGAPWTTGHTPSAPPPWPLLTPEIVKAITDEAHKLGTQVAAHVAEAEGAKLALDADVDEWAHIPCDALSDDLLKQAVQQNVRIVTTIDAMSHCTGIYSNTMKLAQLGARLFYGAEIAHTDIPWGIDANELHLMMHLTGMTATELFHTATAKAGEELGLAPLGTLSAGAPADIIAIKGNAFTSFKPLEYPSLVMSGGKLVVNRF